MGLLLNELLHSLLVIFVTYLSWAKDREGIPAKLLAFALPVLPIALLVWFVTS